LASFGAEAWLHGARGLDDVASGHLPHVRFVKDLCYDRLSRIRRPGNL